MTEPAFDGYRVSPAPAHNFPPTPWRSDGMLIVYDGDGKALGSVRFDSTGKFPTLQLVARLWAASPELSKTLRQLVEAIEAENAALVQDRLAAARTVLAYVDRPPLLSPAKSGAA